MDALLELLALLVFYWRTGLSVIGSLVVAVILASTFQWFTGAFGIALVIGAAGAGVLWESKARSKRHRSN
ncbi:MAG: hypothetical protein QM776_12105 [Rhodocyclaceae bacterium]